MSETVNFSLLVPAWFCNARPSCLRLFWHLARAAASRTFWTAGSNSPIRMAMMAITTNSSISVNPLRQRDRVMGQALRNGDGMSEEVSRPDTTGNKRGTGDSFRDVGHRRGSAKSHHVLTCF